MKKLLCMLTAVLLVFGAIPAAAAETPGEEPGYILPEYSYEELVIGNTTPVEGRFFTDLWGNNSSDLDVRELLHGYNLVSWDRESGYTCVYSEQSCWSGSRRVSDHCDSR